MQQIPHCDNFCGGNFQDWLEVNLTNKCNGTCSWCIEKIGWHPEEVAPWETLVAAALETKRQNIILLGGEPTLYRELALIVNALREAGRNVWITTNGSKLTPQFVSNLNVTGINVSIHDYNLARNEKITGIQLDEGVLFDAIKVLHQKGAQVRFNCNCIRGNMDSHFRIMHYIHWAKGMGADSVRLAELKIDEDNFVDLAAVFNYQYGLNDDPFTLGCNKDAVIDGMNVSFRQMCGLQTAKRPKPDNPKQYEKAVLYYDGKIYPGWQLAKEHEVGTGELRKLLELVREKKISVEEGMKLIGALKLVRNGMSVDDAMKLVTTKTIKEVVKEVVKVVDIPSDGAGCRY